MPTEPPSEDEAPKRTRRAPAAKKAVPKKATPAVKKAARKATLPKQAAPEAPAEPAVTVSGQEPGGTDAVTVEKPAPAPARRTRTTKSAKAPTTTKASTAATEASTAATDATAVTGTTADPAATAATSITTTATTPATAAAEATQVTPAALAPAATAAPTATGVAATAEEARRDSSTTATPAPETPASAVDPADPAAAAAAAAVDRALAVDQPASDESRKTEPPALDPPEEAQPHDETENLPATVVVQHAARTQEKGWRAVGPQLRDHPGFAPELLALAAVDALGPRARDWVAQVRRAYPEADADGVARLATRRFVRMAGTGGALAAGAGMFAPVAELAAVLWTQANLVLHLAAAYGRDPAHPDRAAELLVLTLVHPDDGTARAALAAALAADEPADGPWGRVAQAAWRLATPVAAQ
ncbi:hypothetical protein, partial [Micromonospora chalcea]|uniref:hypothetical protein n=1 Tax=Micromonospora chalcea TaxID=1874 RepID=UPI002169D2D8